MKYLNEPDIRLGEMPFVRFLTVYLLGIGAGYYFSPNLSIFSCLSIAAILCLFLFFGIAIRSRFENFKLYGSLSLSFYFFLFFLAWYSMWQGHYTIQKMHFTSLKAESLIGYIDDEPRLTRTSIKFPLKIISSVRDGKEFERVGNLLVNIRIDSTMESILPQLEYGNEFIIPAKYSLVNSPNNPNEFDYQSYLADHLIWHQIYLSADDLVSLDFNRGSGLIGFALNFRQRMIEKLDRSIQDRDAFAIASALILGYQNQISQETLDMFSTTGTIHVLSVSGLHVGIVFAVFSSLLFWMKGRKWKIIKAMVLIFLVWSYALITGFSPSVLRASIMISVGIISFGFYRKGNIYNTVAASAFFLLLYNPHYISGIGFKLSYLAVLGIVFLYPRIYKLFKLKNRFLSAVWSSSAISIAAQLTTAPLVLYYFHFFPVYFLPANVLIILPASFVVYLGFLVLLIPEGIVLFWVSWGLENLILLMKQVLNLFENFPYATWDGIWIEPWQYMLLYVCLIGIIYFMVFKRIKAVYVVFGCIMPLVLNKAYKEIRYQYLHEIRIYNVHRNLGIGFFNNREVVIYTDSLTVENPRFQYSIAPNLNASAGSSRLTFVREGIPFRNDNLFVENSIIQYGDKSLLIYSKEALYNEVIYIDLLYIRNNAKIDLVELKENIRFSKILVDASNSDWHIKNIKASAEQMRIPIYILKNNFAYVW